MTIHELAQEVVSNTIGMGILPCTAWTEHAKFFAPIIKLHDAQGKEEFDREIITSYVEEAGNRVDRGEIKPSYYRALLRGAERLTEMHDTGKLEWTGPKYPSKFKLNEYYEKIMREFLSSGNFSAKGQSDAMWVCRKYFSWLLLEGNTSLNDVGATEVQRFMIYCCKHMKSSSVYDVKLYMKKLYYFLKENAYSTDDYSGLLSFRVSRESKLYPPASPDEVSAILDVIDRRIPRGKRDYAIIMLGVTTGLRAVDIARLRLQDIDWINGEIKIVQAKTGMPLALPLTTDVGAAIKDYILKGRQQTDSEAVFLRLHVPYKGFANGVGIGDMFDSYRKKANLPRNAFDGKGFHSLRRAVGRNMVTSGVSINTVAQVLGDRNIDSTKKYISLDSRHLKECALDFSVTGFRRAAK